MNYPIYIKDMIPKKVCREGLMFGVEMELEGVETRYIGRKHWIEEEDGSLRGGGVEYVFDAPKAMDEAGEALAELAETFEEYGIDPIATNRASTHIHINIADLDYYQFKDLVALIMMFEVSIAKNSGEDRYNNYFALGTKECDINLLRLMEVSDELELKDFLIGTANADYRYSGINFASIMKYGSLELRFLGAMTKPMLVLPWLEFYESLYNLAVDGVCWAVFDELSMDINTDIMDKVKLPFEIDPDDLLSGIRNAQNIIFTHPINPVQYPDNDNGVNNFRRNQ